MPRVATPIPENYDAITRPVAMETVRQVCALLSLPKNIQVLMPGAAETVPMTGSTLSYDGNPSVFNSDSRVMVEISEELVEERLLSTAILQQENPPCFIDNQLDLKLWPVYSQTQLVLQFTVKCANRTMARMIRDDALMRSAQMRAENLHEINYHYIVPYEYLHLLRHIHTLRENVAGYGESFDQWMVKCLSKKATNLVTVTGGNPLLAIAENQIRPLGWFDFSTQPQPEQKDNDTGPFNVTFEYRLTYDKVIAMTALYPLVVHNQLIDEGWYGKQRASGNILDPNRRHGSASFGRYVMDRLVGLNPCCEPPKHVRIPAFDEWQPATQHPSTYTLATVMLAADPDDLNAVLDLKDLGDFTLEPHVEAFLKTEAPYLNRLRQSIVHLSLYRGNVPVEDGSLLIDNDLIVRSNRPLDLRERYHLRIALVTDLFYLTEGAIERFRSAGQACLNILSTLQYNLRGEGYMPKLLVGRYVAKSDLFRIAETLNDLTRPGNGRGMVMQTVGSFLIVTHRISDYANSQSEAERAAREGSAPGTGGGTPLPERDAYC